MTSETRRVPYQALAASLQLDHGDWTPVEVDACARLWMTYQETCLEDDYNARRRFYRKLTLAANVQSALTGAKMRQSNKRQLAG